MGGGTLGSGDGGQPDAGRDGGGDAGGSDAGPEAGGSDGGPEAGGSDGGPEAGGGDGGPEAGGSDGGPEAGGSDGGGGDGGNDAGVGDGGDGGVVGKAEFRVAALMALPASFDFCWQQSGGAWNGPVMAGWGISTRLAYQQVTEYVPVPAAATTVRLVGALATDCNTSLGQVTFTPAAGSAYLVSSFTQGNVGPQVKAFPDELAATLAGTKLRAIDAALTTATGGGVTGQPVDFYVAGSVTSVLFDNVAFASTAAAGGTVDADGYIPHDAFAGVDLRVRLHGAADLLDVPGFTTTTGHTYSLFTTGLHNLGATNPSPMKLVVCDDTAPAVGHLGVCTASGTQL